MRSFDPETIVDLQRVVERHEAFIDFWFLEEAFWYSWDEDQREYVAARKADYCGCIIRQCLRWHTEFTNGPIAD